MTLSWHEQECPFPVTAGRSAGGPAAALRKGTLFLLLLLLAACGGGDSGAAGGGGIVVGGAGLLSIAITPANAFVDVGAKAQLHATGNYSDGTKRDLTTSVSWASSDAKVASIASNGVVSGVAIGIVTISATTGGMTAQTNLTVPSGAATVTYLHSFQPGSGEGAEPNGPLLFMEAVDNNLYGTTRAGGANQCGSVRCGTIFRMTPDGVVTILHSFGASASDGFTPNGALIRGKDDALYGTTAGGGANGSGTVFRIAIDGTYSTLYSFGASPTDGIVPVGLAQGIDGQFYGVTASGGANHCDQIAQAGGNCGTFFRLSPAGVETVLYSFGNSIWDGVEPTGLIQSNGDFYGLTASGGANSCGTDGGTRNCGTFFRMSPTGVERQIHFFGASPADGAVPQGRPLFAADGNFYGTTMAGGGGACGNASGCGTVFKVTFGGVESVLHAFRTGSASDGYSPTPFLMQGRDTDFYGVTTSGGAFGGDLNGTIFRVTTAGVETVLYSFGPSGVNPSNPAGGLVQLPNGVFYGLTSDSGPQGSGAGTLFKLLVH